MGVVTRVRFEAEGRDHRELLEALDAATMLLRPLSAVTDTVTVTSRAEAGMIPSRGSSSTIAFGGVRDEHGMVMDTEFVEEVIESKIRDDGAIYYVGRRVLKLVPRAFDVDEAIAPPHEPDFDVVSSTLYVPSRDGRAGVGVGVLVVVNGQRVNVWMSPDASVGAAARYAALAQGFGEIDLTRWHIHDSHGGIPDRDDRVQPDRTLFADSLGNSGYALS